MKRRPSGGGQGKLKFHKKDDDLPEWARTVQTWWLDQNSHHFFVKNHYMNIKVLWPNWFGLSGSYYHPNFLSNCDDCSLLQ